MITQRAVIIGFVSVCFYLVALVNQLPSYYSILTWLSITILVSCAGVAALSLQGVSCSWRVLRSRSSAEAGTSLAPNRVLDWENRGESGSGPVLEIELVNKGTLNKTGVMVDVTVRHLARDVEMTRRFMIESLPANNTLSSTLTLRGLARGRYAVVGISLVGSDVLGLFRSRQRVWSDGHKKRRFVPRALPDPSKTLRFYSALLVLGAVVFVIGIFARKFTVSGGYSALMGGVLSAFVGSSGLVSWWRSMQAIRAPQPRVNWDENSENQLLVGPATVGARRFSGASASEESGAEAVQFDALGRGDEMRGTRPYVAGDDLRTVHWKSTARLGRLVVKEFHRPSRQQCAIIWDGAANDSGAAAKGSGLLSSTRKAMQAAAETDSNARRVETALSLTASLCRTWLERGLSCTFLRLDGNGARVVSQSGGRVLSALYIEALAEADALRTTPLSTALAARLRDLPREGDVFLVTTQALEIVENEPQLSEDLRRAAGVLHQRGAKVTVVVVMSEISSQDSRSSNENFSRTRKTAQRNSSDLRVFLDGSGARVVVVRPPSDRRSARSRFAPPLEQGERRDNIDSHRELEQNALLKALETVIQSGDRTTSVAIDSSSQNPLLTHAQS